MTDRHHITIIIMWWWVCLNELDITQCRVVVGRLLNHWQTDWQFNDPIKRVKGGIHEYEFESPWQRPTIMLYVVCDHLWKQMISCLWSVIKRFSFCFDCVHSSNDWRTDEVNVFRLFTCTRWLHLRFMGTLFHFRQWTFMFIDWSRKLRLLCVDDRIGVYLLPELCRY